MLTIVTLLVGFLGGAFTLVASQRLATKRADDALLDAMWQQGYDQGYSVGAYDGSRAGKVECAETHAGISAQAYDRGRAANETRWEKDLLPGFITFARAEVRAEIEAEQQAAAASVEVQESEEDTYW